MKLNSQAVFDLTISSVRAAGREESPSRIDVWQGTCAAPSVQITRGPVGGEIFVAEAGLAEPPPWQPSAAENTETTISSVRPLDEKKIRAHRCLRRHV